MFEGIPVRKSRFHPARGQVLARVLGAPLFSERGWARHCSDATATGRVSKAVGDFTARPTLASVKRAAWGKRAATRQRTHMSGGGATWRARAECAQ